MTHTFFNIITLPEGDDTEALKAWAAVGDWMEQQPGFLGSTLYRNRRQPNTLINKGRYETEDSFMASVKNPEFQRLSQVLTDLGVERLAGLYDEIKSFGAGGN
ncbi:Antibiotic biosynthesis monooxygenase [Parasphingorhabdus marina DSM 22363]|uniref:Antibiotic biosynthesis monooxygenase n=1 Tax=Parasphingorhabdus marina DSM 22363 TaxID=1123272 RepID=A0A1N6H7U4_9SPHN|nr:antibiotic biosynthesis monooxygenase family protein [Parasphingorhabdus marina]SIO15833.1 Antibiotic biosynthesis monooxygenase [Parasphingorhabdus marina DSM 22363]